MFDLGGVVLVQCLRAAPRPRPPQLKKIPKNLKMYFLLRPRILARALFSHEANAIVGGPLGGLAKVGLGCRRQGGGCRCVGEPLGLLSTALGGAGVHRGLFFPTGGEGF